MGLFSKLFNTGVKAEGSNEPVHEYNQPYNGEGFMMIEDVFNIIGRGTVVTGRITSGEVHLGDEIKINGITPTRIDGIEMFRKTLDYAKEGDNVGILLHGIDRNMVNRGDILSK